MFVAPKLQRIEKVEIEEIEDDPEELLGAIDVNFLEVKRVRYLLFFLEEKIIYQIPLTGRDKAMVQALFDDILERLCEAELEHDELVKKLAGILKNNT